MINRLFCNRRSSEQIVTLVSGQYVRMVSIAGWRVQAFSGMALLTFYNVDEDTLLHDGCVSVIPNDGLVIIEAIGACRLCLRGPERRLKALREKCPPDVRRAGILGRLGLDFYRFAFFRCSNGDRIKR